MAAIAGFFIPGIAGLAILLLAAGPTRDSTHSDGAMGCVALLWVGAIATFVISASNHLLAPGIFTDGLYLGLIAFPISFIAMAILICILQIVWKAWRRGKWPD